VKGNSLYEEALSKVGSLELVWLTLKTLKIYTRSDNYKKIQLDDIVAAILNHFLGQKNQNTSKSELLAPYMQFLYLNAYKQLIEYRKSSQIGGLTNDDYLHLLLCL